MSTVFTFISRPRVINSTLGQSPSDAVVHRLLSFLNLDAGWDYGNGRPISPDAILEALSLVHAFRELGARAVEVFPRQNGGVLVSAYQESRSVDAYLDASAFVALEVEVGDKELEPIEKLTVNDAINKVGEAGWLARPSSDSSIHDTILVWTSSDSNLLPSRNQTTEYLWSYNPAWTRGMYACAITSTNTTAQTYQEVLRSSGASQKKYYPMTAA